MFVELSICLLCLLLLFFAYSFFKLRQTLQSILPAIKEIAAGNLKISFIPQSDNNVSKSFAMAVNNITRLNTRIENAETELQRLSAILKAMADAVIITDLKGNVVLANDSFRKMLSVNENIEGMHMLSVIRNAPMIEMLQETVINNTIISRELTIQKHDIEIFVTATTVPVHSDNNVIGIVMTLHDITRLKRLEAMRQDFVANVSHEIKTPITAIKGFAETLLDGALNDKDNAIRFLQMIKSHSDRLNTLVTDLLTLSRIELGDITLKKAEVDVNEIFDYIINTVAEQADTKGLYLRKQINTDITTVYADRNRLIQIILNLVDNAIKFTEHGGITIGFVEKDSEALLYIQDTGIGIASQHLHRLGERFYRVDRARSRELGGTGLGLAIVKHLVNAHKWSMSFESYPGVGTRVNITIANN